MLRFKNVGAFMLVEEDFSNIVVLVKEDDFKNEEMVKIVVLVYFRSKKRYVTNGKVEI